MKSKTKLIILTSSLVLAVAGVGVGVTYAAFTASDTFPVTAQVGIGYLKTYVYLDGASFWTSGVIYAHSFYRDAQTGTCTEISWSKDIKTNQDTYHKFEISTHANVILFMLFEEGDTTHDTSKNLRNQTEDISWSYVDETTNKLFTITANSGSLPNNHATYNMGNLPS